MKAFDLQVTGSLIVTGSIRTTDGTFILSGSDSNASASFSTRVTSNESNMTLATASIAALTASISRLNTEINTDDTDMNLATASIAAITASISRLNDEINTDDTDMNLATASIAAITSSISRLDTEAETNESNMTLATASIAAITASVSRIDSEIDTNSANMTLATASIALNESNMTLATASIAAITASVATLKGNVGQELNTDSDVTFGVITSGDINSSGTITATEIHTTFISSSISVATGSTNFGDATDDHHSFTGSLSISGSGTITGSLTVEGPSTFSTVDINGGTIDGITSLTAGGDLDIGAHDLRAATITADSLTATRVPFAGTAGVLSDDSDLTFATATLSATNLTTTGTIKNMALVSGSIVSTGSFGSVVASGTGVNSFTGLVGIGTASPTSVSTGISNFAPKLDIRGGTGTGVATAGAMILSTAETTIVDGDYLGMIAFQAPLEGSGTDAILSPASIHAEAENTFDGSTNSTSIVFSTADSTVPIERMRIHGEGNIGIGTDAPSGSLHISSAGTTIMYLEGDSNNSGQEDAYIKFLVDGQTQEAIVGWDNNNSATLFSGNTENSFVMGCRSNLPLVFATNNTERMQIKADGEIQIEDGMIVTKNNGSDTNAYLSLGHDASFGQFGAGESGIWGVNNNDILFGTNNTLVVTIEADGDMITKRIFPVADGAHDLGDNTKSWRKLYVDDIFFNGDSAAANALDDYEEGDWTPALLYQNASGVSLDYATDGFQIGRYTKIGNVVHCRFSIQVDITGSPVNDNISIQGFPFTSLSVTNMEGAGVADQLMITGKANYALSFSMGGTTAGMILSNITGNQGDDIGVGANKRFNGGITYLAA